jgi:ketosteroid isomerase-like protein
MVTQETKDRYDQIINDHFMYEATDDVDGVMSSLADEVEHLVVPSPAGARHDKAEIRAFYEGLFADVKGRPPTPIRRQYGDGFVVDEVMWNGYIADGRPFGLDGKSGDVSFRLLHVFDIADGKITREAVWSDVAAIQAQLR